MRASMLVICIFISGCAAPELVRWNNINKSGAVVAQLSYIGGVTELQLEAAMDIMRQRCGKNSTYEIIDESMTMDSQQMSYGESAGNIAWNKAGGAGKSSSLFMSGDVRTKWYTWTFICHTRRAN